MTTHADAFPANLNHPLLDQIFPHKSDFYGLILDQCAVSQEMILLLEEFVRTSDPAMVERVCQLEEKGEALRERNLNALKSACVAAGDREDFLQACVAVDAIQCHVRNIVKEMAHMGIKADWHMLDMAVQLRHAVDLLCSGYQKLSRSPLDATREASLVFNLRKSIERSFRAGLVHLLTPETPTPFHQIFHLFRRREIYQLFRDANMEVGNAGKVLHDIALQFA